MPLRRGELPTDDIGVLWWANGVDLVRRLQALIEEMKIEGEERAAEMVLNVLTGEYNPLPDRLPELGDPPGAAATLPRAPRMLSLPPPFAEHVARRTQDPGE